MIHINTSSTGVDRGWATFSDRPEPPMDRMLRSPAMPSGAVFLGFVRVEVWPLFVALIGEIERSRGRRIDPRPGNWSGQVRPIVGREAAAFAGNIEAWSNHSYGVAFDVEAPQNPLGSFGRGSMPPDTPQIAHRYGFRWGGSVGVGGDYVGRPDPMHLEFMGTPDDATQLAKQLGLGAGEEDVTIMDDETRKYFDNKFGMVLYGDDRNDAADPQTHPDNIQRIRKAVDALREDVKRLAADVAKLHAHG